MVRMRPPLCTLPSHILRQEAYTAAANGACAHAGHPSVGRSLFLSALASQCHTNHCVHDTLCTALIELQAQGVQADCALASIKRALPSTQPCSGLHRHILEQRLKGHAQQHAARGDLARRRHALPHKLVRLVGSIWYIIAAPARLQHLRGPSSAAKCRCCPAAVLIPPLIRSGTRLECVVLPVIDSSALCTKRLKECRCRACLSPCLARRESMVDARRGKQHDAVSTKSWRAAWPAHLREAVQDLPAGQSLGEGLDGVLAVQEDDRIAGLHCRQESSATAACTCRSWRAMCGARSCKKCSADSAPRVPPEKLSMNRTQRCSSGTQVPPDVTHTIGRLSAPAKPHSLSACTSTGCRKAMSRDRHSPWPLRCAAMNSSTRSLMLLPLAGLSAKKLADVQPTISGTSTTCVAS